uniref:Uncharacterized protein n=1 Tax=Cyprinus carpio TaxID=7962 RepID=A0A8C1Y416_CYPCA
KNVESLETINSPLFQYLQDLGHTDFEACSPVSQEEEPKLNPWEKQHIFVNLSCGAGLNANLNAVS